MPEASSTGNQHSQTDVSRGDSSTQTDSPFQREHELQRPNEKLERSPSAPSSGLEHFEQPWMLVGGGLATYLGLKRFRKWSGLFLLGVGGGLIYRVLQQNGLLEGGLKRRLLQTATTETTRLRTAITVDLPVEQVYAGWRDLGHLAETMRHIDVAEPIDGDRDRWHFRARIPKIDVPVQWDAEIVEDRENERLIWRSTEDADLRHEGQVEFRPRTGNRQTEIEVDIRYHPPGGQIGEAVTEFLGGLSEQVLKEDVRRFKQFLETGVVATIEGQTSGRESMRAAQ